MKCASAKIFLCLMATIATLLVCAGTPAAYAQAPVVAAPSMPAAPAAPKMQTLKEVAPLSVPNSAPLPGADDMGDDDEDGDEPFEMPAPKPGAVMGASMSGGAPVGGNGMGMRPMGGQMAMQAGASSAPSSPNIPSAVTDVVTDLKRAEKNVTLEDVARAQDALARLDLLLDIEKKINEIEKTRDERKSIGKSLSRESNSSFGQIPASALNLPISGNTGGMTSPFRAATAAPAIAPKPSVPAVTPPPAPKPSADGYKVEQINGSNGRYRAVISEGSKKNTVSVGEKLGAFTVSNISATGVTLSNDKDRKVLTVESGGVPMVVRPR